MCASSSSRAERLGHRAEAAREVDADRLVAAAGRGEEVGEHGPLGCREVALLGQLALRRGERVLAGRRRGGRPGSPTRACAPDAGTAGSGTRGRPRRARARRRHRGGRRTRARSAARRARRCRAGGPRRARRTPGRSPRSGRSTGSSARTSAIRDVEQQARLLALEGRGRRVRGTAGAGRSGGCAARGAPACRRRTGARRAAARRTRRGAGRATCPRRRGPRRRCGRGSRC